MIQIERLWCSDIDGREKKGEGTRLDREHKRRKMAEKRGCRHEIKLFVDWT